MAKKNHKWEEYGWGIELDPKTKKTKKHLVIWKCKECNLETTLERGQKPKGLILK